MRVTVVPEDSIVIVDGVPVTTGLPPLDPDIHAIQWQGDHGVIEKRVGEAEPFKDIALIQPFIEAHRSWTPPPPPPEKPASERAVDEVASSAALVGLINFLAEKLPSLGTPEEIIAAIQAKA